MERAQNREIWRNKLVNEKGMREMSEKRERKERKIS